MGALFGRHSLNVKLPQELVDMAARTTEGAVPKVDGRRTVATSVGWLLEMYLVNYPDVTFRPTPRGQTPEPAEVQVNIAVGEEMDGLLSAFMERERERLKTLWRATPRPEREGKRPRKPEYRGLVIAAIREGALTKCYGCK